jgi:hypothetical protein
MFAAGWAVNPACAQLQGRILDTSTVGRNVSVMQRDRPEYSSQGILIGGFIVQPSVAGGVGATNNIFQTEDDKKSDAYLNFTPRLTADTTWARNAMSAEVHGDFKRFLDYSVRNEDAFGGSVGGRYDIGVDSSINAQFGFDRYYESQYFLTTVLPGSSTIPVDTFTGTVSGTSGFGPLRLSLIGNFERQDYGTYTSFSGDTLDQDNRDRTSYAVAGQVDYAVAEGTYAFAQIGFEKVEYDTELSPGVANRDSKAVRAIAGVSLDLTQLVRGRVGVGYIRRSYRSPLFDNAGGLAVEARLEYFPSELTTVTINARRVLEDASTTVQGGFFRTGGDVRVDHELLRNLILSAVGRYEKADYGSTLGSGTIAQVQGLAKLLVSPHFSLDGNVNYARRKQDTAVAGNSFRELRGLLSARYQF